MKKPFTVNGPLLAVFGMLFLNPPCTKAAFSNNEFSARPYLPKHVDFLVAGSQNYVRLRNPNGQFSETNYNTTLNWKICRDSLGGVIFKMSAAINLKFGYLNPLPYFSFQAGRHDIAVGPEFGNIPIWKISDYPGSYQFQLDSYSPYRLKGSYIIYRFYPWRRCRVLDFFCENSIWYSFGRNEVNGVFYQNFHYYSIFGGIGGKIKFLKRFAFVLSTSCGYQFMTARNRYYQSYIGSYDLTHRTGFAWNLWVGFEVSFCRKKF